MASVENKFGDFETGKQFKMTHFRRYEFKKRRYCSTPSVANLPHDFSDDFVEGLKVG